MPAMSGSRRIIAMLRKRSRKLISKDFTLCERLGTSDDQKKKLNGVTRKQNTAVMADKVTDNATLPFANIEKKLDALPPGHAATKIIPSAISLEGDKI